MGAASAVGGKRFAPETSSGTRGRTLRCRKGTNRSSDERKNHRRVAASGLGQGANRFALLSSPTLLAQQLLGARRSTLTSKHGRNGKELLVAGTHALVIVHEFERTFPQLHDRHVGRR